MIRTNLEQAEIQAEKIGKLIKQNCPDGWGFFVILATHGENGLSTYISSCTRDSSIKMLREMADHLEKNKKEL